MAILFVASPAAWSQPPDDAQPDGQATEQQPAPDTPDDQARAEAPAQGPSADVDSAQGDAPAPQAVPDWVLGAWCNRSESYLLGTDHSVTYTAERGEAPSFTGRWELESIVRFPNRVYLTVTWSFGYPHRVLVSNYYDNDPSFDILQEMGHGFSHC